MPVFRVLVAVLGLLVAVSSQASDWDSCADDLDRLRRAARDATDIAARVKSVSDDLESCRQSPKTNDPYRDRCSSLGRDFEGEVSMLNSELDTVSRRVRDVSHSCGVEIGNRFGSPSSTGSSGNQMCDLMRRYVGRLPDATLIDTCKKSMPEAECRKCIAAQ
jgi:hypothetical protein